VIWLALWTGCVLHRPPEPAIGPRGSWEVAVLVSTGGSAYIESHYELVTEKLGPELWKIATVRTWGQWVGPGDRADYDSASPSPADPWPLTLQHLVASTPAKVRMEEGRPVEIVSAEEWEDTARRAVYASELPADALPSAEALADADGLLADLARTFPGSPRPQWERTERIAGVEARVVETCSFETERQEWTCKGNASETDGQSAKLFEVTTWTSMGVDRHGLRFVETGYSGTLVTLAPGGMGAKDRPITGFRRVVREGVRRGPGQGAEP
jgi:hypothetical protein